MLDLMWEAQKLSPEIVKMRTYLHENPELSMQEYNTSAYLEKYIREHIDFDRLERIGKTGLFVELKGTKEDGEPHVLVFRGDIDALPIQEAPNMSPRSKIPGVMHACGHDVHGSINVGAMEILSHHKNLFSGSIYFFIQPGEEIFQGAKTFLNAKEIDFKKIDGVVALHCSAELEVGQIGVRYGTILASADEFEIQVVGKGGHGAHCHTLRDPIVSGCAMVGALQSISARETNPADSVVVSVCKIHGGVARNVCPNTVTLEGTYRTLNQTSRDCVKESIERIVTSVAKAYRTEAKIQFIEGVPPFVNDNEWVDRVIRAGKKAVGEDNLIMLPHPAMGGEDFAFIKEKKPGVFVRLGVRTHNGPYGSAHSPTFYCDPGCIAVGIKTIISIAADYYAFPLVDE